MMLLQGKIQYGKLPKKNNIKQIRSELYQRRLQIKFDKNIKWTKLIKLLKENEYDNNFFKSFTDHN